MTNQEFKKKAKELGVKVYQLRKVGTDQYRFNWYKVVYAYIIDDWSITETHTRTIGARNYKELFNEFLPEMAENY